MFKIYFYFILFVVTQLTFGQGDIDISALKNGSFCRIGKLQKDAQENIIIAGRNEYSDGNLAVSVNQSNYKIFPISSINSLFLLKLNKNKEVVWVRSAQIDLNFSYAPPNVLVDDSSNLYLTGKFQGRLKFDDKNILDSPTGDNFIAKYSAEGQLKWTKEIVGSSDDGLLISEIDNQGNLYFIGRYQKSLIVGGKEILKASTTNPQSYLLKIDRNGEFLMAKSFDENINLNTISVSNKNEIFIAGNFQGNIVLESKINLVSEGAKDIFYAKFDNNNQILWAKTIGGKTDDYCSDIITDKIGNIFLAGVVSNIAKFDSISIKKDTPDESNIFLMKAEATAGKIAWIRHLAYRKNTSSTQFAINFLHLNENNEPYISLHNYYSLKDSIMYNSHATKVQSLIKYNKNGNLLLLKEYYSEYISSHIADWNSMVIDSQKDIIIGENIYISYFRGFNPPANVILKIYKDINNSCKSKDISIIKNDSGMLSLSDNFIDNNAFNYQWYKNGNFIQNATQPTFPAKDVGYYSLKLINKTNASCQISSSNTINILPAISKIPIVLYLIQPTILDALGGNNVEKHEWFLDNQLIEGISSFKYNYTLDGKYKVKAYYQNGTVVSESNEVTVKNGSIYRVMKETVIDDNDVCRPVPNLKASVEGINALATNLKFQWYLNSNAVKDSTKNHFKPIMPGEYEVSIFVPAENQTYFSGKYKLVIEDFPKSLSITKIEDNCGAKALLKVDDSFMQRFNFQSIVWRLDGTEIPEATQPFYNATKTGLYTFSVKYLENSTKKTCNYNSFVNFEKKTDFKLNVGYAYAGSGCAVDSFKVFTEQNPKYSYVWTKNDVSIQNQVSNELFIKDKSRYKGIITRNDGCINETEEISLRGCTADSTDKFLLLNPPKIVTDKISLLQNESATLSVESCANVNLQWLKDSKSISGATKKTLEVQNTGIYALEIEKMGCIATSNAIEIVVEPILAVGEEIPAFDVQVYPNPTQEKLFVSIPTEINSQIDVKMIDISGKLIGNYDFSTNKSQLIDLKSLQEGVYLLVFETKQKRVVRKIIKKY